MRKNWFHKDHISISDLPRVRKAKRFRPKKVGPEVICKRSRSVFMRIRVCFDSKDKECYSYHTEYIKLKVFHLWTEEEQGRTVLELRWTLMNTETLGRSTEEEREGLRAAVEAAEVCRSSLVQPGRCSGQRRGGSEARRRRSGAEASRGGRRSEETKGKKWMTLGPIYKIKGGGDRHENQGAGILMPNRSDRFDYQRVINWR